MKNKEKTAAEDKNKIAAGENAITGEEPRPETDAQETNAGEQDQPRKKLSLPRRLFYDALLIAASVVLAISVYKLVNLYQDYERSAELYQKTSDQYVFDPNAEDRSHSRGQSLFAQNMTVGETESSYYSVDGRGSQTGEAAEEAEWYERIGVNLSGLKKENKDVVGWIYLEGTDISYPVLYSGDNDYYLRRSMDKKYATAGSIFIEGLNKPDFEDNRTIIYGHNMNDETMFGKLKYLLDKDFYKEHSFIQIFVDNKVYRYQIFSCFIVDQYALEYYQIPYADPAEYQAFIDTVKSMSLIYTGVSAASDNKMLTLSTCSNGSENRLLVNAIRVDEHFSNTTGRISDLTIE